MITEFLVKVFEHNNWANQKIIEACYALTDEQLDSEPQSSTMGSIRKTLMHLVGSQAGYLALLTLPVEERAQKRPAFADLQESARVSGAALLKLAGDEQQPSNPQLQTMDGYRVDAWVVMVQIINHATEHREQIKSMLTALGITPPSIDGWEYGESVNALTPISK